jgi:hypothetical protein
MDRPPTSQDSIRSMEGSLGDGNPRQDPLLLGEKDRVNPGRSVEQGLRRRVSSAEVFKDSCIDRGFAEFQKAVQRQLLQFIHALRDPSFHSHIGWVSRRYQSRLAASSGKRASRTTRGLPEMGGKTKTSRGVRS